jgi:KAP family P-loop domain
MSRKTGVGMPNFRTFKVLLDDPAAAPSLGFDDYARAFSEIIRRSAPQFAVGIFGDWGSGKTTLMRAIERELQSDDSVVTVWFNAWRYEREPHLIVPMLDTLREALAEWPIERTGAQKARRAATTVAHAAKALALGLKVRGGLPIASAEFDPSRMAEAWREVRAEADEPVSFYHASFNAMKRAIDDFAVRGRRRIVVFVDDLDRCLPMSALEVLESMKLFFDLEGFVFVVGLDQSVIERSIELKYGQPAPVAETANGNGGNGGNDNRAQSGSAGTTAPISGADYVKKIFQVPFGLPRISRDDLEPFFESLVEENDLPASQKADLYGTVWEHLDHSSAGGSVNPREVKRLINAYTLQMKLLSAKLAHKGRSPDANVVLALQTMAFRSDWRRLYELLSADPELFVSALRPLSVDQAAGFSLSDEPLPQSFATYVFDGPGEAILNVPSLGVYVTSAESTRSSDTRLLQAHGIVADLRHMLGRLGSEGSDLTERDALARLHDRIGTLEELLTSRQGGNVEQLLNALRQQKPPEEPSANPLPRPPPWGLRAREALTGVEEALRMMRRSTQVGSTSV